jgi:hypothetical protein
MTANQGEPRGAGRVQASLIQTIGAFAAMIAAVVTLSAYVFGTPHYLNNWWQRTIHGYSVTIEQPENNVSVGSAINIKGTANVPPEWNLVVLVQSPDELKYYITSGGAVTVDNNHTWHLDGVSMGSRDPKQHVKDLNKDYKIVALLVDEEGQQQVETGLSRPGAWMPTLPHSVAMTVEKVHLKW